MTLNMATYLQVRRTRFSIRSAAAGEDGPAAAKVVATGTRFGVIIDSMAISLFVDLF